MAEMLATELAGDGRVRVVPSDLVARTVRGLGIDAAPAAPLESVERLRHALSADYLFASGSREDLVRKIDALVDQPARLLADREASRAAASAYSIEASLQKLLAVYRRVTAS